MIDTYEEHDANGGPVDEGDYDGIRFDEPDRGVAKCDWMSAKASAPAPGTWTTTGDFQQSRLLSVCGADRQDDDEAADLAPVALDATSWAGELGRSAYRDYEQSGQYPGFDDRTDTLTGDDARLALWARSECAAGTTYHRVSVRPKVGNPVDLEEGGTKLSASDRAELLSSARKLMTRYLNALGGWPSAQHCHATKVLGGGEEWS
ncbi:hypothetical protein [Streptomyces hokutonensis]|uniref:hypothetical protein n=1 Tax=Streptomyces hokutonensis TaxID=1306990 RepID=UPI0037F88537